MATHPAWVLYKWLSDSGYFLQAIVPGFTPLEAQVGDRAADVLDAVPAGTTHFAFHLNCTITHGFPEGREELVAGLRDRGIQVLNGATTDISKRRVQRLCADLGLNTAIATREGDPAERIIVKTDLNFGGDSEWALTDEQRGALGVGPGSDIIWNPNHYRVLPRREVEEAWWADPRLVRERFISNAGDCWYRAFLFLDRLAVCELHTPNLIKKVGESEVRRVWMTSLAEAAVPAGAPAVLVEALRRFAPAFPLDVGTIDAVVSDAGDYFLIDVNTTPAFNYPIDGVIDHMRGALAGV